MNFKLVIVFFMLLMSNKLRQIFPIPFYVFHLSPLLIFLFCYNILLARKRSWVSINFASVLKFYLLTCCFVLLSYFINHASPSKSLSLSALISLSTPGLEIFLFYLFWKINYQIYGSSFIRSALIGTLIFISLELIQIKEASNIFLLRSGDRSLVSAGFSEIHVFGTFWSVVGLLYFKSLSLAHLMGLLSVSRAAFLVLILNFVKKITLLRLVISFLIILILWTIAWETVSDTRVFKIIASAKVNSIDLGYFRTGTGIGLRLQVIAEKFLLGISRPFAADLITPTFNSDLTGKELAHLVLFALIINFVLPFSVVLSAVFGSLPGLCFSILILVQLASLKRIIATSIVATALLSVGPFFFWWLPISKESLEIFGGSFSHQYGRQFSTYSDIGWVFAVWLHWFNLKRGKKL